MIASDPIRLPDAARELAVFTGGPTRPYSIIYRAVLDGRIPATRGSNGRYSIERSKLPEVARALGLTVPPNARKRTA